MLQSEQTAEATSQWRLMWRKFKRNRTAVIGGVVVLLFYLTALFGDFVAPYSLEDRMTQYSYLPPQKIRFIADGRFQPHVYGLKSGRDPLTLQRTYVPDPEHKIPIRFFVEGSPYKLMGLFPTNRHLFGVEEGIVSILGTDGQGRDMFSRIIKGSQISLTVGLVGVALSLLIGAVLGVASGYYGGWVDNLVQRGIEIVRSFPPIPLWMALTAALPQHWPPLLTYFVITVILSRSGGLGWPVSYGVKCWPSGRRLYHGRSAGWGQRSLDHLPASDPRHLQPYCCDLNALYAVYDLGGIIPKLLGLGIRPPLTSWESCSNRPKTPRFSCCIPG